jgi:hypothetical protein
MRLAPWRTSSLISFELHPLNSGRSVNINSAVKALKELGGIPDAVLLANPHLDVFWLSQNVAIVPSSSAAAAFVTHLAVHVMSCTARGCPSSLPATKMAA